MRDDEATWTHLRDLTARLEALIENPPPSAPALESVVLTDADAVITHIEVCDSHGVGKFLKTLFLGEPTLLSIRSASYFDGQSELGQAALCISHTEHSRDAIFSRVLDIVGDHTIKRILCVPYFPDDIRTAIALKEIFGVPLCTYIMDDQNICVNEISDVLMQELLARSSLRLGISPELCSAYRCKYGHEFCYLPPLVPGRLIPSKLVASPGTWPQMRGIIIGNIWGQQWLKLLRRTVRGSGVTLTWHSNGAFPEKEEDLRNDSIFPGAPVDDHSLVDLLRNTSFAVVPSGKMDEEDDRQFLARLSLPSRIPYMMATSHIPILVLGSAETAAARFVRQYGIGMVVDYDRDAFVAAVNHITTPEVNRAMRKRALVAAGRFTDTGAAEWIWQSLAKGTAIDGRYQEMMPASLSDPLRAPTATSHTTGTERR